MNNILLYCAAVNARILEMCTSQKTKYCCIGGAVLATALLAWCSGSFAFYTVFGNVNAAVVAGFVWGIIIFNLDRLFLSSVRLHTNLSMEWLSALPRIALAVLISIAISKPLELYIFRSEISAEMTASRNATYLETKRRLDSDPAYRDEIQKVESDNSDLRRQISAEQARSKEAYTAYISEAEGTAGSGIEGRGPVFKEKKDYADQVAREFQVQKEADEARILKNDQRLIELQQTKAHQLAEADSSVGAANGLLARIHALHSLCNRDWAVFWTSWIVTLLLLALETAPLVLKMLGTFNKRRPYERLLDAHEANEEAEAHIAIFEAENRTVTETALVRDRDLVRLDAQRESDAHIMRAAVDARHALGQKMMQKWHDHQLDLLDKDPDQFFQVH